MKIGQLSALSDCSIQTIRYYEKEGLLEAPLRSEGNFRLYDQTALNRLKFVKRCRTLGITLSEIHQLLDLQKAHSESCTEVSGMIDKRVREVQIKINELQQLETELHALRNKCDNDTAIDECGIIENLANPKA